MMRAKCWMAGLMVLGLALQAAATEGGGGNQGGAEGFMSGALPPPGQYIINYSMYYSADSFKGGDGHTSINDFDAHAFVDVVRFINVTPVTILGGNWAQHVLVPFVWEDVGMTPGGSRLKDKNFGLGDIDVDPIIIGWHMAPFHVIAGVDTYLPVGKYHDDGSSYANLGRNYWTFEPVLAVTYLNEGGQELSAKMMYDINTENQETDYLSGQEFHTDFVAAQHCGDWAFGVGGYWYYQTTDDKSDGAKVNGNCGRQMALGPQVSYELSPVTLSLAFDHEFDTKNRPQGDVVWLKAIIPL
jgi:hypothetical protein